jgi:hypothetical protein
LHDAIKIRATAYLVKPIVNKNLLETIISVCTNLENEKLAQQYKKEQLCAQLNAIEEDTILKLINIIDIPVVLTQNENIFYVNSGFRNLFSLEEIKKFLQQANITFFRNFIAKKDGYAADIVNIPLDTPVKIIFKIPNTKFYEVKKKKISLHNEDSEIFMYMFYDITKIETNRITVEYHKNKLKNANKLLSEFFYKNVALSTLNSQTQSSANTVYSSLLTQDQRDILDKSHSNNRVSATEYVLELASDIVDEIVALKDIEAEMNSQMNMFACLKSDDNIKRILLLLKEYASQINMLIEFSDLATALKGFTAFLLELPNETIQINNRKITMTIENIIEDITEWRKNIFENKIANDIHYLDASLFSSCLQLQFELSGHQDADFGDDLGLELF